MNTPSKNSLALFALCALCTHAVSNDSGWVQVQPDGLGSPFNEQGMATQFNDHMYISALNISSGSQMYTSADGTNWAPSSAPGFGDPTNGSIVVGVEFGGALLAGTQNDFSGGQIWRSTDGAQWTEVAHGGLGSVGNFTLFPQVVFQGEAYAFSTNFGGGQAWRSSDGINWVQSSSSGFGNLNNVGVFKSHVFGGELYVGTVNFTTGGELWKTADGTNWTQVAASGFGVPGNLALGPSVVFEGELYVGAFNAAMGAQMYRSADGQQWTPVAAPGFGDPGAQEVVPMLVHGNEIIVSAGGTSPARLWRSVDGDSWVPASSPGHGDPNNLLAISFVFADQLYSLTANPATGMEIWALQLSALGTGYCSSNNNSAGSSAKLKTLGDPSLSANCLRVVVEGATPNSEGVFFLGDTSTNAPFGDGNLCVAGALRRISPLLTTSADGSAGLTLDFDRWYGAGLSVIGGSTHYQFWYRDLGSVGAGFNLSDAMEIVHLP